jgi:hypothetical protein
MHVFDAREIEDSLCNTCHECGFLYTMHKVEELYVVSCHSGCIVRAVDGEHVDTMTIRSGMCCPIQRTIK